jgi:Sec-independent protein translocase protein TatA
MPDLNIFGIGLQELAVFVVILLLLFGPNDLTRMAKSAGRFINRLVRSENYQVIQRVSTEMQNLPRRIVEEAQIEDLQQIGQQTGEQLKSAADDLKAAAQSLNANPAPSPRLTSAPPSAPAPPPQPATPNFSAWTQELDSGPPPDPESFAAWTRETQPKTE